MPLADLTHSLTQSTHVPLYYPVLRIWMSVFGDSPTALRSLSVLLGMCTAIGSGWLGWLVLHSSVANRPRGERETSDVEGTTSQTKWFGLFCAAVCGLNAFQVHASVEARMYSLGTFLTILSTGLALHVRSNPDCLRHWMLLTIVTLASLYTHHLLALTALVQALWLAWQVRRVGFLGNFELPASICFLQVACCRWCQHEPTRRQRETGQVRDERCSGIG